MATVLTTSGCGTANYQSIWPTVLAVSPVFVNALADLMVITDKLYE